MSSKNFEPYQARIAEAVVRILWRQWRVIGAAAAGDDARLIVDPEALILASLIMSRREPRLDTTMADWLESGSTLISTQRLKNLADRFPQAASARLGWVAGISYHRGRDHRWRTLLDDTNREEGSLPGPSAERAKSAGPMVQRPAALLLRTRTAFGLSIKSDLIAVLHGSDFAEEMGSLISTLGYRRNPTHLALRDLTAAGVVRGVRLPSGTGYTMARPLFTEERMAPWGWWNEVLGFLLAVTELEIPGPSASEYARTVMLRRAVEPRLGDLAHARLLHHDLQVPEDASSRRWMDFVIAVMDRASWREHHGAGAGSAVVPDGPDPGAVLLPLI